MIGVVSSAITAFSITPLTIAVINVSSFNAPAGIFKSVFTAIEVSTSGSATTSGTSIIVGSSGSTTSETFPSSAKVKYTGKLIIVPILNALKSYVIA